MNGYLVIDQEPRFEIRTSFHQLTGGTDLTQIDGIAPYTALKLISEIGTDMTRWAAENHFTSWRTLAPKKQDLRRPSPQLEDAAVGESRRRHPAYDCDEPWSDADRARRLLSPLSRPHRQATGHHRDRPQSSPSWSIAHSKETSRTETRR